MKRLLLACAMVLSASCSGPRTGDLLFVSAPAGADGMDGAIVAATGDIIHVAIVEKAPDGELWVIDATPRRGVDRHPLDTLKADFPEAEGYGYLFARPDEPSESYAAHARQFIGQPYDQAFLPDNGAMYCSELVRESFRRDDGSYLFDASPMNFRAADGSFPHWWVEHYTNLGMPIPQDTLGTNPQDMYAQCRPLAGRR